MDHLFFSVKTFFAYHKVIIDNFVFRLHYQFTAVILICSSLLVTGRQYIENPIHCIPVSDIPSKMLNTFCWIHTTFSIEEAWFKKVGKEIPYPGVDNPENKTVVYHAYYQWVGFVLALQAVMFYVPRYFWKSVEGGRVKNLVMGLHTPILPDDTRDSGRKLLVDYFHNNCSNYNLIFAAYVLAEFLNFFNVVGQIFFLDRFLGGEFSTYGIRVLQFTDWDWTLRGDPMIRVFPRMTKCTYMSYGPSGSIRAEDTLCILPLNVVNEKIYVFLWFWLVILAIVSGFALVYRVMTMACPVLRLSLLHLRCRSVPRTSLNRVVSSHTFGDWLLLTCIAKNMDAVHFRHFVEECARSQDFRSNFDDRHTESNSNKSASPVMVDRGDGRDQLIRGDIPL